MRFRNQRKAEGTVISELLILLIGVVITSFILFWGLSLISGSGEGFIGGIFANNARIEENISIDNININFEENNINIYVRNYGDKPVKISAIYINYNEPEEVEPPITVTARDSTEIEGEYNGECATTCIIKIATERGTVYEEMFVAP